MEQATDKQVIALKRFARNSELSQGLLKGIAFDSLSKQDATALIQKCIDQANGTSESNESEDKEGFKVKYSQNYRNGDGSFKTVVLTDEELAEVREAHKKHCIDIMSDCMDDFPNDRELQLAMFDKMADKSFTWIQQALDEKVRTTRGNGNGNQH